MSGFITSNGTFFDRAWTEWLDDHFLKELEWEALKVKRSIGFGDGVILENVRSNMSWYTDHVFSKDDIHRRFKLANLRYHTWKGIIEHEAVTYGPTTYSVNCTVWTWIELCESYELAEAYHKVGLERMWPELCVVFGPDEVRLPGWKNTMPEKPPRAFEHIRSNGKRLPSIVELLADIMEEEKRKWDEKQRWALARKGLTTVIRPADCMSSTRGDAIELAPATEVINISPEMERSRPSTSNTRSVRAKRSLYF